MTVDNSPVHSFHLGGLFSMKRIPLLVVLTVLLATLGPLAEARQKNAATPAAPAKPAFDMTLDNIMRGADLFGYPITDVRWSPDSKHVFFSWKKHDEAREKPNDTYVVNVDGSGLRKLSEEE